MPSTARSQRWRLQELLPCHASPWRQCQHQLDVPAIREAPAWSAITGAGRTQRIETRVGVLGGVSARSGDSDSRNASEPCRSLSARSICNCKLVRETSSQGGIGRLLLRRRANVRERVSRRCVSCKLVAYTRVVSCILCLQGPSHRSISGERRGRVAVGARRRLEIVIKDMKVAVLKNWSWRAGQRDGRGLVV